MTPRQRNQTGETGDVKTEETDRDNWSLKDRGNRQGKLVTPRQRKQTRTIGDTKTEETDRGS